MTALKKSAVLMMGPLKKWTVQRFAYGLAGGVILPLLWMALNQYLSMPAMLIWIWVMVVLMLAGELLERYLFFRAVIPLKMPH
jgi:DMSO reductase anchor subunit